MAAFTGKLLLFLAIYITAKTQAANSFGIVEPFPENIYAMEFTSAQVTCVAFDSSGQTTPERIQFKRKDQFARYSNITANDNLNFTSMIKEVEQDGKKLKKLFVTLHIRNVTQNDDSQYGSLGGYECHAFAVGDPTARKRGFSVNVILKTEIPRVSVSKPSVLQRGDGVILVCNVTQLQGASTLLKKISWYKGGVLKKSVRYLDPRKPQDILGPLTIKQVDASDGGNYTCLLEVLLRNVKEYGVSDSTMIRIAPWLDKPKEDLVFEASKGRNISFECAAKGFPLQVEWKVQKEGEDTIRSCINGAYGNYHIHRSGIYAPYVLTVSDLQYTDRGFYYCCLPSNCSDNVKDNCQRFVLRIASVTSQSSQCHIYKGLLLATLVLSAITTFARNEL